ncbi:SDR family NAD(P)-dependent oxidoreductase [Cryptosporangium sp. NPDC048952]|uniref:SDR family NAD(P)-dependent oxidoreductase n=1 Tax=Cryptosporangium sp. NPDC048952 TaxID=3363961 RepID=UPI0037124D4E
MDDYRFDGRAVVVTGAGRGIGRAYARLLGDLGAKVVVNDLGSTIAGSGADDGPAQTVVKEIIDAGGTAVADTSDVSTPAGGAAPIALAVERFGRIDAVINNAGNVRFGALPDLALETLESLLSVHVKGAFNTSAAAWPHFLTQDYGRIVLTGSIGMFGLPDNLPYATAKAAMIGMARSMSQTAAGHDITVNVIAPNAMTRMAGGPSEGMDSLREQGRDSSGGAMDPALVAPMAAYLASEACAVSGEVFLAGAGRFAHLFVGVTEGYLPSDPQKTTVEDVATNLDRIKDHDGFHVPDSLMAAVGRYMSHR